MLPFTGNEQVLYSAIPEMHSRHRCSTIYAALDCQENRSVITAIISRSWLETLMITVLIPDKTVLNNNLLFPFLCCCVLALCEHKVRFTYLSICYYADYGIIFTRMPLDNSIKQLWRLCTMPRICDSKQFVSSQWRTDKVDPEYVFLYFWRHSAGLFV